MNKAKELRKLQKKLKAAELETDLFADLILKITEQADMQLSRIELQSVRDVCERAQRECAIAKQDMRDAEAATIELEDTLNKVRNHVWNDLHTPIQALYEVRRLVPNKPVEDRT